MGSRFGSVRYGSDPYAGYGPANLWPTRDPNGFLFTSNDRNQVVVLPYLGTLDTAPQFRYWYAGRSLWEEIINDTQLLPSYPLLDENGTAPVGSLETAYRWVGSSQEMLVEGVIVEFVPCPAQLLTVDAACTFDVHVEGVGVTGYKRSTFGGVAGTVVSTVLSFSEDISSQTDDPWPNVRSAWFPCRLPRVRAARVVLTNIRLVKIVSVEMIGTVRLPGRER